MRDAGQFYESLNLYVTGQRSPVGGANATDGPRKEVTGNVASKYKAKGKGKDKAKGKGKGKGKVRTIGLWRWG